MTKDEALKMAIEALSQDEGWFEPEKAIQACKEALEQTAQEPVAIVYSMQDGYIGQMVVKYIPHKTKLYTHPAPSWQGNKEFVGLSDNEINDIKTKAIIGANGMSVEQLLGLIVSLTEQALKEKNT